MSNIIKDVQTLTQRFEDRDVPLAPPAAGYVLAEQGRLIERLGDRLQTLGNEKSRWVIEWGRTIRAGGENLMQSRALDAAAESSDLVGANERILATFDAGVGKYQPQHVFAVLSESVALVDAVNHRAGTELHAGTWETPDPLVGIKLSDSARAGRLVLGQVRASLTPAQPSVALRTEQHHEVSPPAAPSM